MFQTQIPDRTRLGPAPDQISLRPLGHTGTGPEHFSPIPGQERDKEVVAIVGSPKTGKFVPPHLRLGFAGREKKPVPEVLRSRESSQKYFGSLGYDMNSDVIFFGSIPMHGSRNNNSVLEYNGGENLILDPRLQL
ncbi:hypothetical protein EZV62_011082 [Acer yangbiense]|uniref:Uncharacterized protein n=1 Tax=Acer yangbiense TaxID=1000413 RepID=A0A5C7I561_9ROSI|nr:hypothetical protein EZV62_011082 [Acer yangbiense]